MWSIRTVKAPLCCFTSPPELLLTWRRCHNKSRCWHECRRLCPEEQNVIWWRAEGGTYSTRSGWEPAAREEHPLIYSLVITQPNVTLNGDEFLKDTSLLPFGDGGWYRLLGRYPVKMLSSLGITHHVSPTSTLFFGGRNALNWLAEKEDEGTAGLFQERRPFRELWDTCKSKRESAYYEPIVCFKWISLRWL